MAETAEVLAIIFAVSLFALVVIYMLGVWWYPRVYFIRRHGVHFTGSDEGAIGAICVGIIWPIVVFFLPNVKYPELCSCRHHVLARQQARLEDERYHEALRQEQGEG